MAGAQVFLFVSSGAAGLRPAREMCRCVLKGPYLLIDKLATAVVDQNCARLHRLQLRRAQQAARRRRQRAVLADPAGVSAMETNWHPSPRSHQQRPLPPKRAPSLVVAAVWGAHSSTKAVDTLAYRKAMCMEGELLSKRPCPTLLYACW